MVLQVVPLPTQRPQIRRQKVAQKVADQMPQLPPDYETRHRLALALCQHLGINPEHVLLGSMQIELGPDAKHRVTWTGTATINLDNLSALIHKAHHPDDTRTRPCHADGQGPCFTACCPIKGRQAPALCHPDCTHGP